MRLFLAFPIDTELKKTCILLQNEIARANPLADIRFVTPSNFHITLIFFGNVKPTQIDVLWRKIQLTSSGIRSFQLVPKGLGIQRMETSEMIWYVWKTSTVMNTLVRNVKSACETVCLTPQTKYPIIPHITLARLKQKKQVVHIQNISVPMLVFSATTITLYHSELRRNGPLYTPLKQLFLE